MTSNSENKNTLARPKVTAEARARFETQIPAMQTTLYGYFRCRVSDSYVPDLIQMALLKMMLNWGRIAPGVACHGYLRAIASTVYLDHLREQARRREVRWPINEEGREVELVVTNLALDAEASGREAIERVLADLDEETRQIWELYTQKNSDRSTIAKKTGLSYGKVARLIRRVTRTLVATVLSA